MTTDNTVSSVYVVGSDLDVVLNGERRSVVGGGLKREESGRDGLMGEVKRQV